MFNNSVTRSVACRLRCCAVGVAALAILAQLPSGHRSAYGAEASQGTVLIKEIEGTLRVEIGGELFTEYVTRDTSRPILFPVIGPHEIGMTRNYPMVKGVENEATDHVHHRSLWFTHGDVNGVDFWSEMPGHGRIVHDEVTKVVSGAACGSIETRSSWISEDDKTVCTDTRKMSFTSMPVGRAIDFEVTLHASHGKLTLGDTKEGSMAIRTHPMLRLAADPNHGCKTVGGQMINSSGVRGAGTLGEPAWGKRANWIDYWATIDGHVVGIAIFDHPSNPRHPTTWMARGYGLVGANPFGLHDYLGEPEGSGDMVIPSGESVTFRYRFLFHTGDYQQAKIAELYDAWAGVAAAERSAAPVFPVLGRCLGLAPATRHNAAAALPLVLRLSA